MMFKAAAALSLLPIAFASPQYGYGPAPAATSSSSSAASSASASASTSNSNQMIVQVGQNGFAFSPSNIQAPAGTLVTFVFGSTIQHSVTQSSFADPCTPMSGGFDSGLTIDTTFTVNVTDASTPVYFFCKFPTHCGLGMVGTINAPSSGNGSNSAFTSAATAIGANEKTVNDNGPQTGGVGAIATAPPSSGTSVSSAPTSSGSSSSGSSGSGGSSSGASSIVFSSGFALAGIVAGVFALAL